MAGCGLAFSFPVAGWGLLSSRSHGDHSTFIRICETSLEVIDRSDRLIPLGGDKPGELVSDACNDRNRHISA